MNIKRLAVDLAKDVFQLYGADKGYDLELM